MVKRWVCVVAAGALTGVLGACAAGTSDGGGSAGSGTKPAGDGKPKHTLADTPWLIEEVTSEGKTHTMSEDARDPVFRIHDGAVVARPCNTMRSTAEVADGTVRFGDWMGTRMACQGVQGDLESALTRVLRGTVRGEVRAQTLTLTSAGGTVRLSYDAGPPLVGTRWEGKDPGVYLVFGEDGTLTGKGSCNSFRGTAEVHATGRIDFGGISVTKMGCARERMAVDAKVFAALHEGRGRYDYQGGGNLVIVGATGEVLGLTASDAAKSG